MYIRRHSQQAGLETSKWFILGKVLVYINNSFHHLKDLAFNGRVISRNGDILFVINLVCNILIINQRIEIKANVVCY